MSSFEGPKINLRSGVAVESKEPVLMENGVFINLTPNERAFVELWHPLLVKLLQSGDYNSVAKGLEKLSKSSKAASNGYAEDIVALFKRYGSQLRSQVFEVYVSKTIRHFVEGLVVSQAVKLVEYAKEHTKDQKWDAFLDNAFSEKADDLIGEGRDK